jgi:hypothetical protein
MDRLIQMILNTVLRQLINRGVKSGLNRFAGPKTGTGDPDMSYEAKQVAKKARQAADLARRLGK